MYIRFKKQDFIDSIKTPFNKRQVEHIHIIRNFLKETNFGQKVLKKDGEKSSNMKILTFLSVYLQYMYLDDDKSVFKIDDKGDLFYIVLKGKVNILRPIQYTENMNVDEYFQFLINLRKNNDMNMLRQTIEANNSIFKVDIKDVKYLNKILKKVILANNNIRKEYQKNNFEKKKIPVYQPIKLINRKSRGSIFFSSIQNIQQNQDISSIIHKSETTRLSSKFILQAQPFIQKKSSIFNTININQLKNESHILRLESSPSPEPILDSKNDIKQNQEEIYNDKKFKNISKSSPDRKKWFVDNSVSKAKKKINIKYRKTVNIDLYSYVTNKESKTLKLYKYENFTSLNTGAVFGDAALEKTGSTRNATIATSENCHFGIIDGFTYSNLLKNENLKIKVKEQEFLLNNFFFKTLNHNFFAKKFFNDFIYKEYKKGELIFKENEPLNYIYFIKNGEVETNFKKSLLELNHVIETRAQLCNFDISEFEYNLVTKVCYNIKKLQTPIEIKVILIDLTRNSYIR